MPGITDTSVDRDKVRKHRKRLRDGEVCLYVIKDKRDQSPIYIGMSKHPARRVSEHLSSRMLDRFRKRCDCLSNITLQVLLMGEREKVRRVERRMIMSLSEEYDIANHGP